MRKIIFVIFTLVLVIVIAPYFIGTSAEKQIREQVSHINTNPAYHVSIINYEKGWFNSTAIMEVAISTPKDISPINAFNIKISQEIQHGPVLWQGSGLGLGLMDSEINFEMPETFANELHKVEGLDQKVLFVHSRTTFDLTSIFQLSLNKFTIKENENTLNINKGFANISIAMDGHIEGSLNWDGMSVNENNAEVFNFGLLKINTEQVLISGNLYDPMALFTGFINSNLSHLDINGETDNEKFSIEDIEFNVTSNIKDDLLSIASSISAKNSQALGQHFDNFNFNMTLENLDVDALTEMNVLASQSQGQDPMVMAAKFQGLLPRLIEKNPILKINQLGVITSDGEINADLSINIDQSIYNINNPMTMMLAINANAHGSAPEAFFKKLGMTDSIESMLQQDFLIRDQQNLKFEFSFKNAQALLNGKPIPLGL